jgi:hypothetical protein
MLFETLSFCAADAQNNLSASSPDEPFGRFCRSQKELIPRSTQDLQRSLIGACNGLSV